MNLELVLSNTNNLPLGQQFHKQFDRSGGSIGRDPQCDFTLLCNEKVVSRLHAKIIFRAHSFYIYDASANGVFINGAEDALGDGNCQLIQNGDSIRIGGFTLQAKVAQSQSAVQNASAMQGPAQSQAVRVDAVSARRDEVSPAASAREGNTSRANASSNLKLVSTERKLSGSSPLDNFNPPAAFIPPDWNSDLKLEQSSKAPTDVADKRDTLRFANQQTRLLEGLLKGLGANKSYSADQLTPETMELIGRSLRTAVNGAMMNRKLLQEAKSELSLDAMPVERQMEADALGHIEGTEAFITAMLDPHHKSHNNLANLLAECVKDLVDDQKDIFSGIPQAIAQVAKGLSPASVDAAFEVQQNIEGRGKSSIQQLGSKLAQNSRKWAFYERHWPKLCDKLKADVRKFYESKMLLAHAKRMKNKNSTAI